MTANRRRQGRRIECRHRNVGSPQRGVDQSGYVTAETAMVLPVFALLLAIALWAIAVGGGQLRCIDAARDAARAVARGESDTAATAAAQLAGPAGAHVTITTAGGMVTVEVSARIGLGRGALDAIPAPTVSATVTAQAEADADPGGGP